MRFMHMRFKSTGAGTVLMILPRMRKALEHSVVDSKDDARAWTKTGNFSTPSGEQRLHPFPADYVRQPGTQPVRARAALRPHLLPALDYIEGVDRKSVV